jgi:hypothetical protein
MSSDSSMILTILAETGPATLRHWLSAAPVDPTGLHSKAVTSTKRHLQARGIGFHNTGIYSFIA